MQKILDISYFGVFAAAVNLLGISFAQLGKALHCSMENENKILGFIPPYIEKNFGIDSKVYSLLSCPMCLSGQFALWMGFFLYAVNGDTGAQIFTVPMHILSTGAAIWWAAIFEQKLWK